MHENSCDIVRICEKITGIHLDLQGLKLQRFGRISNYLGIIHENL